MKKNCPERDSNSRPPDYSRSVSFSDYETDALTNCAIKAYDDSRVKILFTELLHEILFTRK